MDYYIIANDQRQGPYDLVSLIRKVRNGSLTRDVIIEEEGQPPRPAETIPKLAEIFQEDIVPGADVRRVHHYSLKKCLKSGWDFLVNHFNIMVHAGVIVLITVLCSLLLGSVLPAYITAPIAYMAFLLLLFMASYFILRMARGQPADSASTFPSLMPQIKPLAFSAFIIALASGLGALLIIPGLVILAFYIFTPFLIIDRHFGAWEAMEISRKAMFSKGIDFYSVVFALVVINFIGAIVFIIPLLITLPVTVYALAELYDENF